MAVHRKLHPINDTLDHGPGTNDTVLGTQAGAVVEVGFGTAATAGNLVLRGGSGEITLPTGDPTGDYQAAHKKYVDDQIAAIEDGRTDKGAVQNVNMIDDSLSAPPGSPVQGDGYIVGSSPTGLWSGFSQGDLVVWTGSAWSVVLAGSGGNPANGARVVVTGLGNGTGAGSFAGEDTEIATYVSGTGWTFAGPSEDGWVVIINGEGDPNENSHLVYDTSSSTWVQTTAGNPNHNDTQNIQGGSASERYHHTLAEHTLNVLRYVDNEQ